MLVFSESTLLCLAASQRGPGGDDQMGVGSRRRLHPIQRDPGGKGLQKNLSLSSCGDYITWTLRQMDRRWILISPVRHYSASWNKELCETYRFRCGLSRIGTGQRSSVSWLGRLHCRWTWEQWITEIRPGRQELPGKVKIWHSWGINMTQMCYILTFPGPSRQPGQICMVQNGWYRCPEYSNTCFRFNLHLWGVF